MTAAEVRFADVTRAVVAAAAEFAGELERRVVGDGNVRTAQGNAWAAICADRARAQARADMEALVAALAAGRDENAGQESRTGRPQHRGRGRQRAVGSSPRSSASQAALVSTR